MSDVYTVLHFSDLHFGHFFLENNADRPSDFPDFFHRLKNRLEKLMDEHIPSLVIISGDIGSIGKDISETPVLSRNDERGYLFQFLELFRKKNIPVLMCAGNHDLNYEEIKNKQQFTPYLKIHAKLDEILSGGIGSEKSERFSENQASYIYIKEMNAFFFAVNSCIDIEAVPLTTQADDGGTIVIKNENDEVRYELGPLERGTFSYKHLNELAAEVRGKYPDQFQDARKYLVCHHPRMYFAARKECEQLAAEIGIKIVFSGHRHWSDFFIGKYLTDIISGSIFVVREQRIFFPDLEPVQFNKYEFNLGTNELKAESMYYDSKHHYWDRKLLVSMDLNTQQITDNSNFSSDIQCLRDHSDIVLARIRDTIGESLNLPRTFLLDEIESCIEKKSIVIIHGEPMVGKSALLKMLARRYQSKGQIIAFSVERFFGTTLDSFLNGINIRCRLQDILQALPKAHHRYILIDGLERAKFNSDKKRILDDLLFSVNQYNQSQIEGSHPENCWKLVFSSRLTLRETIDFLLHLETRASLIKQAVDFVEIPHLVEEELKKVVSQFPLLEELSRETKVEQVISLPLVLDMIVTRSVLLSTQGIADKYTVSWLFTWFWKEFIRLSDNIEENKGHPDQREKLMLEIAEKLLYGTSYRIKAGEINLDAMNGLTNDRLIKRENDHLVFVHDIYEDWALTAILLKYNIKELPEFLLKTGESYHLAKSSRLLSLKLLEVDKTPEIWLDLLVQLGSYGTENYISPQWYQIVLSAPLFSSSLASILPSIKGALLENNCILLNKLLRALRTTRVEPDPVIWNIFRDLPEEQLSIYLAYNSKPVISQWTAVIHFILENITEMYDSSLYEISSVIKKWMIHTEGCERYRQEIVELGLKLLESTFLKKESSFNQRDSLTYEEKKQLRENFLVAVFCGSDCLPDQVDNFIRQKSLSVLNSGYYGFERVILKEEGYIPICKNLPKTAAWIFSKILCEKLQPDKYGSYFSLSDSFGIRHTFWYPPTYWKGPFLLLLRMEFESGLKLVHDITNHATKAWKIIKEGENKVKPLPQEIKLPKSNINVWGDELVYQWYRYPSVAHHTINAALMALEYWMDKELKGEADTKKLFEDVLENTTSIAVVGVCVSVALKNFAKCLEAIVPIIENSAFWIADMARAVNDQKAESVVESFMTSISLKKDKPAYNILLDLAREPHRKYDIRYLVQLILFSNKKDIKNRIQDAILSFSENLPFFFEQEKENSSLTQKRMNDMKILTSYGDVNNYQIIDMENGQYKIVFNLPTELRDLDEEERIKKLLTLRGFLFQVITFRNDGTIPPAFPLDNAISYARELEGEDNISYQPEYPGEPAELRANALAAFAAGLTRHQWFWVKNNDLVSWCRNQLIIAASRPEPRGFSDTISLYEMGYRRSAAIGLSYFLSKQLEDRKVSNLILDLSHHQNKEVKAYLYDSLKVLWPLNQDIVWDSIDQLMKTTKIKLVEQECFYPARHLAGYYGKSCSFSKKIILWLKKLKINLLSVFWPISIDIKKLDEQNTFFIAENLEPVLYCFLIDKEVTVIDHGKLSNYMRNLAEFTIRSYTIHQEDRNYNKWAFNPWNQLFFRVLAASLLQFPQNTGQSDIIDSIMANRENTPALMEEFLRYLLIVGSRSKHEDRFVELWTTIGAKVLSSSDIQSITDYQYLADHKLSYLGLLIFYDPYSNSNWMKEWSAINRMTEFVDLWNETIGHNAYCFPNLIRFLDTANFSLALELGIDWLYNVIHHKNNPEEFLAKSGSIDALSSLLSKLWSRNKDSIRSEQEKRQKFAFLISIIADQGNPLGAKLQNELLKL
ncbi:MAG: metallophosphoesterase [Candidatus Odinarchaeota archaeon]